MKKSKNKLVMVSGGFDPFSLDVLMLCLMSEEKMQKMREKILS